MSWTVSLRLDKLDLSSSPTLSPSTESSSQPRSGLQPLEKAVASSLSSSSSSASASALGSSSGPQELHHQPQPQLQQHQQHLCHHQLPSLPTRGLPQFEQRPAGDTSGSPDGGNEIMGAHSKTSPSPESGDSVLGSDHHDGHSAVIGSGEDVGVQDQRLSGDQDKDALPPTHLRNPIFESASIPSTYIEPDFSIDDEAYAASVATSYVSSLASDIRKGIEENGRLYAAYGIHKPWVPIDDREMSRNDLQHYKFLLLMHDNLFLAPVKGNPQKVLDLGTGSGIWAIDMADQFESAEVIGVDTAATQPDVLPPNVIFEIDDVENDWLWDESSFDLIHGRELIMAIHDWPRLIKQAFHRLKPGGYLELSGSYPHFLSDDNTLPQDSAYVETGQIYFQMSEKVGCSGHEVLKWKRYLEEAGYVDVQERMFKVPTNPWPKDPTLKKVGAFELLHYRDNIANVFARGYSQILDGDPAYFEILMARARREVMNRDMHSYVPYYVVYGKRPD